MAKPKNETETVVEEEEVVVTKEVEQVGEKFAVVLVGPYSIFVVKKNIDGEKAEAIHQSLMRVVGRNAPNIWTQDSLDTFGGTIE